MGFRKPLDYNSVHHQIYMTGVEVCNARNDGFTQWGMKQDLYRLKWLLEDIMRQAPTFVDESEFVREHEKKVMFRELQR